MISLFDLWRDFQAQNNTSQNGWWRPESDFERRVNNASISLWNDLIDEAERDQKTIDELKPFLISKNIIVKNENSFYGTINPPDDYGRFAGARVLLAGDICVPCKEVDNGACVNEECESDEKLKDDYYESICQVQVEKIDNQRWPSVLTHLTKRPTLENPKTTQMNGVFQVAPRKISVVVFNYYKKPLYATFKYTLTPANLQNGSGDVVVYDSNASQPLEWDESVKNDLLKILKKDYIGYTRDAEYAQIDNIQKP
jgi:hypothetical protein